MDIDELKRRAGIEEAEDVPMDIEELQKTLAKIKQRVDSGDVRTASSQISQLIRTLRHASKTPIYSDMREALGNPIANYLMELGKEWQSYEHHSGNDEYDTGYTNGVNDCGDQLAKIGQ